MQLLATGLMQRSRPTRLNDPSGTALVDALALPGIETTLRQPAGGKHIKRPQEDQKTLVSFPSCYRDTKVK